MPHVSEALIECHMHVFDPARFPYAADAWYQPLPGETGSPAQLGHVLDAHGVRHALIVGPNSGYGPDNRCLLDTIARGAGRYKGITVVGNEASRGELQDLRAAGIVGVAFNVAPLLRDSGARLLFDHCGRPDPRAGVGQAGFAALLDLARTGRACVKLSGLAKCSALPYPYADAGVYVRALVEACTPQSLVWASDWPFLRAPERIDYGPLLRLFEQPLPDAQARQAIFWHTPKRLFGF